MLTEFWNNTSLMKRLYDRVMDPVADSYHMTRMELDILLFLANNPTLDTASDIIACKQLTKSHISASVKNLVAFGYLERFFADGNRKLVHLKVLEAAAEIVEAGRKAQKEFFESLFVGFSQDDLAVMEGFHMQMAENLRAAIKERG